jgi:hypothetical protein
LRLQRELRGERKTLWLAAFANDDVGYILSVRVLKEGGYEVGEASYGNNRPRTFAEDVEPIVVRAAHDVVGKVREN